MRSEWPLVGRDDELQFVVDTLGTPDGRGVALVGPAGVGKTRLGLEGSRWANGHDLATAWVSATVSTAEIPFGAMAPLLGEAIATVTDRVRVLARGCRALAEIGGHRRLVLCVDDAHLLDPLSAALVHHAVTTRAVLLLATIRRGPAAPDEVTALWKDGLIERLEVTGLSRTDMNELTALVLGGPVHGATLEWLWRVTEGNTLFLREVIDTALSSGDLTEGNGLWRVSGRINIGDRLVDLVELRLGSLTASQERVIEHIALAEPVDVDLVAALTSADDLQDAERTGAITAFSEGGRMRVRMAHPLYGEVVRARTPLLRAHGILGALADALDARGGHRPDEILAMATWRLDSGGDCSHDVLLDASRQARNLFDYRLAERLAHAAVTMHGGLAASLARAECLYLAGRFADAEASLAAIDVCDATERQRVDYAITRASNLMWGLGDFEIAERLLADVSLAESQSVPLDDLRALRARLALARAELPEVFDLTDRVLQRAGADPLARLAAAAARAPALVLAGRSTDAIALLDEFAPLAIDHLADFPQGVGSMLISRVSGHWFAGDLDRAAQVAAELYELGISVNSWDAICAGARSRAWVELARGRPRLAMRWAQEAVAAIPEGDLNGVASGCHSMLAEACAVAGDPGARQALADMDAHRHQSIRMYDAQLALAHAWVAAMSGELTAAATFVRAGAAEARRSGALAVECHLLHSAVRFDRPEEVAGRLIELEGLIEGPWAGIFADHAVALISQGPHELERVASSYAQLGAMLLAAEAAAQAARAFRRHGDERSRRSAATRAAVWAALCEQARTPALATPDAVVPLTRRENEIAALAGQGMSSPEIARRLTVSPRTVEGHLHRLYAKLGVNRREDLDAHRTG